MFAASLSYRTLFSIKYIMMKNHKKGRKIKLFYITDTINPFN